MKKSNSSPDTLDTMPLAYLYTTACIISSFGVGLAMDLIGLTLLHMGRLLGTSISGMALATTFKEGGRLAGTVLCGLTFDRYHKEDQILLYSTMQTVFLVLSAWMPNLAWFTIISVFHGIGTGYISSCGISFGVEQWKGSQRGQRVTTYLIFIFFSLGALLSPVIAGAFMCELPAAVDELEPTSFSTYRFFVDTVCMCYFSEGDLLLFEFDNYTAPVNCTLSDTTGANNVPCWNPERLNDTRLAYLTESAILTFPILLFIAAYCINLEYKRRGHDYLKPYKPIEIDVTAEINAVQDENAPEDADPYALPCSYKYGLFCLVFLHTVFLLGMEQIIGGFLITFLVKQLHFTTRRSSMYLFLFWAVSVVRLVLISLSPILIRSEIILWVNHVAAIAGSGLIVFYQYSPEIIIGTALSFLAFALGGTIAEMLNLFTEELGMSATLSAVVVSGFSIGKLVFAFVVGCMMEMFGFDWFIYLITLCTFADLLIFVAIIVTMRVRRYKYPRKDD